jgi:phage tail-like protein
MFALPTGLNADTSAQVGFFFHVVIGGNPLGEFRAVHGLGRSIDPEEIREGGRNYSPHLRLGPSKYQACKIEWGLSIRATLFDWINAVDAGYGFKRMVNIFQLDPMQKPVRIYTLWDAWPISWEGANLDANQDTLDTEEITIVYEFVTMVALPSLPDMGVEMPTTPVAITQKASAIEFFGFGSTDVPAGEIEELSFLKPVPTVPVSGETEEDAQVLAGIDQGEGEGGASAFDPGSFEKEVLRTVAEKALGDDESESDAIGESKGAAGAASAFSAVIASKGAAVTGTKHDALVFRVSKDTEDTDDDDTAAHAQVLTTLKMSGGKSVATASAVVLRMSGGLSFEATVFEPIVAKGESDGS